MDFYSKFMLTVMTIAFLFGLEWITRTPPDFKPLWRRDCHGKVEEDPSEDLLDADGYPTVYALDMIRCWDYHKDMDELWDFLYQIWYYKDLFIKREDGVIELHTGGWSGNEEVIGALQENIIIWNIYWISSKRGGHYEFKESKSN